MESRKQRSTATDRKGAEGLVTDSGPTVDHNSWGQLSTVTGIAGIAGMVLLMGPIIARSGQEPDFNGTPDQVVAFYRSINTPLHEFGSAVGAIGLLAIVWFIVGICLLLSRAEGSPPWRSAIAAASGLLLVAMTLSGGWEAAAHRADSLDPQVALYAFDEGNISFANGWVALGSFLVCCGWVLAATAALPRWTGWLAIVAGIGLVLARFAWTTTVWLLPYALFWLWLVCVCVYLLRHRLQATG